MQCSVDTTIDILFSSILDYFLATEEGSENVRKTGSKVFHEELRQLSAHSQTFEFLSFPKGCRTVSRMLNGQS